MTKLNIGAREYLSDLQVFYHKAYLTQAPSAEASAALKESAAKLKVDLSQFDPRKGVHLAIARAWERIVLNSPPQVQEAVDSNRIAAGAFESPRIDAFIAKDSNDAYAILFSDALAQYLNKILKFSCAKFDLASIKYCSRKAASEVTAEDLTIFINDTIENYNLTGELRGPQIILHSGRIASTAISQLISAETFILCHELGHWIHGDLDENALFAALPQGASGKIFVENLNHAKEFAADRFGFDLMTKCVDSEHEITKELAMSSVIQTFFCFFAISPDANSTHPSPLDRIRRLIDHAYGPLSSNAFDEFIAGNKPFASVFPN